MSDPVLKIEPKKYNGETTIVSMRMHKDMLKEIDTLPPPPAETAMKFFPRVWSLLWDTWRSLNTKKE